MVLFDHFSATEHTQTDHLTLIPTSAKEELKILFTGQTQGSWMFPAQDVTVRSCSKAFIEGKSEFC